jgi:hypothetical protein
VENEEIELTEEQIEEKRAARKAELAKAELKQRIKDLQAIDELEILHGDNNIAVLRVKYVPGLPTLVAVRAPKDVETKRFRARVKSGDKDQQTAAVAEVGETCLVYPSREEFAQLAKVRTNLSVDAGSSALDLSVSAKDAEGKA